MSYGKNAVIADVASNHSYPSGVESVRAGLDSVEAMLQHKAAYAAKVRAEDKALVVALRAAAAKA